MELKWGIPGQSAGFCPAGSNRTFMELKCGASGGGGWMIPVLIVPLWN